MIPSRTLLLGVIRMGCPQSAGATEGRTIRDIRIERLPEDDDDWLVLEFGTDPAISPLRVPTTDK